MYWILFVMGAIAALVIALLVGGLVTPRVHTLARTVVVPRAAAETWAVIREVGRYADWRHDLEFAEVVDTDQPQPRWRETSTRGSVTFGITRDVAPTTMVAVILDEDLPIEGEWTWTVTPEGDGTRVTITERGSIKNPIIRFIAAHLLGYHRSMDTYLRALAQHLGVARPEPVDGTPNTVTA
ncbi:MAG: SRPBCC family protein [Gemmatimonadaceae bacterium]